MIRKIYIFIFIAILAGVWSLGLAVDTRLEKLAPQKPGGAAYYEPVFDGKALRILSLGYDHALASYYWIMTIQYAMDCSLKAQPMDKLYHITDVLTDLDPHYTFAYEMSWIFLMHYDVRPLDVRIKEGYELLEKGWRNNPTNWRLAQSLAFHLFFFMGENLGAANLYDEAFKLRKPPFYMYPQMASSLRATEGDPRLAKKALVLQYETMEDNWVRDVVAKTIREMDVEIKAWELDKVIKKYVRDMGRCPDGLNELVEEGYIKAVPPDGMGGTFELNEEKCRSESTTIGRKEIYMNVNNSDMFK